MSKTEGKIRVKQVGSPIRRDTRQALFLIDLVLRKIGSELVLVATVAVLKLIEKVRHRGEVVS